MRSFFRVSHSSRTITKPSTRARLRLELLEERDVPATITVTNPGDAINPLDGVTLREAITMANVDSAPDTIVFDSSIVSITYTGPQVDITGPVTIQGNGANQLTINASGQMGLQVNTSDTTTAVTISDLTITGANTGINVLGIGCNLTLSGVAITNSATGVSFSGAALAVSNSTIAQNKGDGIMLNTVGGTAAIDQSTIAFNTGNGVSTPAGSSGTATTIRNSTIVNNGNGISMSTGVLTLSSTIVARNTTADVANATFVGNNNNNLIGQLGSGPGAVITDGNNGNQVGTTGAPLDPQLQASLTDNGGPTLTLLPLAGSPAIDKGAANGFTTDQRGLPRTQGTGVDVGAVEVQPGLTANDDFALTQPNTPVTIAVLANDSGATGVTAVSAPSNGTAVLSGNQVIYTPNPGFTGIDTFTYTATDGTGGTDVATVQVNVTTGTPSGTVPGNGSTSGVITDDFTGMGSNGGITGVLSPAARAANAALLQAITLAVAQQGRNGNIQIAALTDFDGDGLLDIVLSARIGRTVTLLVAVDGVSGEVLFVMPTINLRRLNLAGQGAINI